MSTLQDPPYSPPLTRVGRLLGLLVCLEVVSGAMQGYFNPIYRDIATSLHVRDGDVNWFEAGQLMLSVLLVPALTRLADLVGHRRVLLASTAVTAAALWGIALAPGFAVMLVAWTLTGAYVVWLPLEIALLHQANGGDAPRTVRSAAVLVGALELAVIAAALVAGHLAGHVGIHGLLAVPACLASIVLVALALRLPSLPAVGTGRFDPLGLALLTVALGGVLAGLVTVRLHGIGSPLAWLLVLAGCATLVPFARHQLGSDSPLVDLRALRAHWRVQLTALLLGIWVLGAQVPASLYARTDPRVHGYGLGLTAAQTSLRAAFYVLCLALGSLLLPRIARRIGQRRALVLCCLVTSVGYAAWIPVHDSARTTLAWIVLEGLGSGGLLVALPAAAAVFASSSRTGSNVGVTNAAKVLGGAVGAAVFAVCLSSTGSLSVAGGGSGLGGYQAIWGICTGAGLAGALVTGVRRPSRRRP